jgi:hypothetical protein
LNVDEEKTRKEILNLDTSKYELFSSENFIDELLKFQ